MAVATHTTKATFTDMSVKAASLAPTDSSEAAGSDVSTDSAASTSPVPDQPSTGVVFPIAIVSTAGISAFVLVLTRRRKAARRSVQ